MIRKLVNVSRSIKSLVFWHSVWKLTENVSLFGLRAKRANLFRHENCYFFTFKCNFCDKNEARFARFVHKWDLKWFSNNVNDRISEKKGDLDFGHTTPGGILGNARSLSSKSWTSTLIVAFSFLATLPITLFWGLRLRINNSIIISFQNIFRAATFLFVLCLSFWHFVSL